MKNAALAAKGTLVSMHITTISEEKYVRNPKYPPKASERPATRQPMDEPSLVKGAARDGR